MGGYGSGGRNKTHRTVEGYSRLDSFALRRSIADCECISGSCTTLYAGGSILFDQVAGSVEIAQGGEYRHLKLDKAGGSNETPSRLYFRCPLCSRRVRYLYNFRNYHVCRHCLKANYVSQQNNRGLDSIRRRMRKLIEKDLGYTWWRVEYPGQSISEISRVPKPRYMRWAKYFRLMMEYRKLQDDYTRELLKICGAFLPAGWKAELNDLM